MFTIHFVPTQNSIIFYRVNKARKINNRFFKFLISNMFCALRSPLVPIGMPIKSHIYIHHQYMNLWKVPESSVGTVSKHRVYM